MVVYASMAIKWLLPEDDFGNALDIADKHQLLAPQLIYAECASIVWKKVRRAR